MDWKATTAIAFAFMAIMIVITWGGVERVRAVNAIPLDCVHVVICPDCEHMFMYQKHIYQQEEED